MRRAISKVRWQGEFRPLSRVEVLAFGLSEIRSKEWRARKRRSRKLRQGWREEVASGRCGRGSSRSGVLRRSVIRRRRCACRRYRLVRQRGVWQIGQLGGRGRTWDGSRDRGSRDQAFGIATRVDRGRLVEKPRKQDHLECLILDS